MSRRLDVAGAMERAGFSDALSYSAPATAYVSPSPRIKLPVPADVAASALRNRNCGECLWDKVEVVALTRDGVCPKCGADYGAAK